MAKKPKVKIVLNSAGIEELLKSQDIYEQVEDAANDLKRKISGIYKPEEEWEIEKGNRSDRTIVNLTNDSEGLKWKELAEGKIAAKVGRSSRKSTRTQEQNEKAKEKQRAKEEERAAKKAYWASDEGKAVRRKQRQERKAIRDHERLVREEEEREGL